MRRRKRRRRRRTQPNLRGIRFPAAKNSVSFSPKWILHTNAAAILNSFLKLKEGSRKVGEKQKQRGGGRGESNATTVACLMESLQEALHFTSTLKKEPSLMMASYSEKKKVQLSLLWP